MDYSIKLAVSIDTDNYGVIEFGNKNKVGDAKVEIVEERYNNNIELEYRSLSSSNISYGCKCNGESVTGEHNVNDCRKRTYYSYLRFFDGNLCAACSINIGSWRRSCA